MLRKMKIQHRYPIIYFAVFFLSLFVLSSNAQVTWNGDGDGVNWSDPDNWDTDMVPVVADDVIIPAGSMVVISSITSAVARTVSLTEATLTIQAGGSLSIDGDYFSGNAFDLDESVVINSGSVMVTMAEINGIFLDNASTFTNNGTISVDNSSSDGLQLNGSTPGSSFINNGILNFDNDGGEPIKLEGNAFFRNSVTGVINIDNDREEAIHLDSPGAEFINEGNIFINGAGEEGIELDLGTSFTNTRTGNILISNIGLGGGGYEAIEIDGGTFINDGTIEIDGGDGADEGIDLDSGEIFDEDMDEFVDVPGIFINNGYITIENVRGQGIEVQGTGSVFTNNLLINVGLSSSSEDIALIRVNATLINSECGVINMTSSDSISVESNGIITNEGVMTTVYTGEHNNDGTFTNNGEIATPDGMFNIAPNALMGTGMVTMGEIPRQPSAACNGVVPIPALSEWALGILALLMTIFGLLWMKERRWAVG